MPNTTYGPYSATNWVAGVTALGQTAMNNLEKQASVSTHSMTGDEGFDGFFLFGGQASGTPGTTTVNIASGRAFVIMTDGSNCRIDIASATQTTVTINATYNLYLQPDGTFYWSTSNSPQANSLYIATVTTNGSGQISVITDKRPQLLRWLGGQSGLSLVLPGVITANVGGALAAPVVTGMSASAVAGAGMGTGAYKFVVTYAFDGGETLPSAAVPVTTTGGNNQVSLTGIPVSADPRVTRRKIYRTAVGGSTYSWVKTIGDNSTTTYTDAASDAAIASTVKVPPTRSTLGGNLRSGYPWGTSTPNTTNQGTVTGTTFNQTTLVTGDTLTAALFNGTSDKITFPTSGLPTGNQPWSLLAVVKPTNATNAADAVALMMGDASLPGGSALIAQAAAGGWFAASGLYRAAVLADAPLRYYRMNDPSGTTLTDIGSQAQNGTLVNAPTLGVASLLAGDPDTSMTFNGTTQRATIPTTSLPTGNAAWTIEAIAKPTNATNGTDGTVISLGTTVAGQWAALIQAAAGQWKVATFGGDTTPGGTSGAGVTHHLLGSWDGTNLNCWVDGVLVGFATPGARTLTYGSGRIGDAHGDINFFAGTIDEVAIYGSALSNARIAAHYNAYVASMRTTAAGTSVAGTKHQLGATYDGTTLTCYLDGASINTLAPSARSLTQTVGRIADLSGGGVDGNFFPGTIQKAAVFGYALNAQQMALYNTLMGGASGNLTFDQQVGDDAPLRYFTLGDATGATVAAETSRYETSIGQDGQLKATLPLSLDRGFITTDGLGGLTVTNLAKPTQIAGQATGATLGVPVIVAQANNVAISGTALTDIVSFMPTVTGMYRTSIYFYINGTNNGSVLAYTRFQDVTASTLSAVGFIFYDSAAVAVVSLGTVQTVSKTSIVQVAAPSLVYAAAGAAIIVRYQNSAAGTIADQVSAVIERMS